MSLINLKDVKYRQENRRGPDGKLKNQSLTPHYKTRDYLPPTIKKQSTCEIEIDAWASDILNKEAIEKGLGVNPGIAAIWDEEKARRMLAGFDGGNSQLEPPKSPLRSNLPPTDNDLLQVQRFQRKLTFISQNSERSVSGNSDSSLYPVEVNNRVNLLDASHLERHIGPKNERTKRENLSTSSDTDISLHLDRSEELRELRVCLERIPLNSDFKSVKSSDEESLHSQDKTLDQSIFDIEDVPLVDILEQLAEGHNTDEQVDEDSILGSHCSAVVSEYKSDEEIENEVPDLNLTALEIDNLSLNPESLPSCSAKSKNSEKPGSSIASLSLESVNENNQSNKRRSQHSFNIPQFDGADDLPRKRNSSIKISSSRKKRKITKDNEDSTQVFSDLNKRLNSNDKELLSSSNESISELDRTIVPEENVNQRISKTSESTDNSSGNTNNFTLIVEEKLICNYKSGKKNAVINRKENLQSPRRASKSPRKSLKSPSRKSPKKLLKSPSRRSPRKSVQSPGRNYSSLNIIITPSKSRKKVEKEKFRGIYHEDESSGEEVENEINYFTQKRVNENTFKIEACRSKVNRKLSLGQREKTRNSDNVPQNPGTSKELIDKQNSENSDDDLLFLSQDIHSKNDKVNPPNEKVSEFEKANSKNVDLNSSVFSQNLLNTEEKQKNFKGNESDEEMFLTQEIQIEKSSEFKKQNSFEREIPSQKSNEENEIDAYMNKSFFSQNLFKSQSEEKIQKIVEDDDLFLTQKSQSSKCSSEEINLENLSKRKSLSQKTDKQSENEELNLLNEKSQDRKISEDELNKNLQSDENWSLSQNSFDKCLADDESSKGSFPLTQKPNSETNSQNEMKSDVESNKIINVDNISPLVENDKVYDEETDSSDFEENLEILLKNISPEAELNEIIEEDISLSSDDTLKAEDTSDCNLNIAEEINNEVCDAKNLLTVTFTEFTNTELNSSLKLSRRSISKLHSNRLVSITPKFCPPTRQHVIDSLSTYGIPSYRNQEPFYSNRNDVRQHKDTVHQIINKKDVSEFPPFKSEIGGVVGIKLWRRMKVNEFHSFSVKLNSANIRKGLAERRLITITPLHLPPDRKNVVNWIKNRKRLKRKENEKICQKEENKSEDNAESNKNQKVNEKQENGKLVNENESGNESKKESKNKAEDRNEEVKQNENSGNSARSSPFGLSPMSKEADSSGGKTRESLGNNSSLYSTLRPSELLTTQKKKGKNLKGLSLGQIDFSMDETKSESDVANQNLQNAKAITTVSFIIFIAFQRSQFIVFL